jgi:hypothetical protein
MGMVPAPASAPGTGPGQPGARAVIAWFAAALAGSALLCLLAGLIWGEVAPRALLQDVSPGTAQFVNVETSAFIVADGWFCLISAVAGLITGLAGYRFLLAARTGRPGARTAEGVRAAAAAGLILGGIAGAFVMLWLGEQIGLSSYNQHLASSPAGTLFPESLALGAKSALAFWPLVTAVMILVSEWGTRRSPYPGPEDSAAVDD